MRGASANPSVCSVTLCGSTRGNAHAARAGPGAAVPAIARRPLLDERAVLAHERHEVGDGRERDQVELALELGGVASGRLVEGLGELVGDAGRAQLGRIAADLRMHDRACGQLRARAVMVGDDHVHAELAGARDLRTRGDAAVGGDQQPGAGGVQLLDARDRQAVALVAAGQPHVTCAPRAPQGADEHRRRADAVDVVVAVDRDRRAGARRGA